MNKKNFVMNFICVVVVVVVIGGMGYGFYYLAWESAPKWHDLGTVTAIGTHNQLVWSENQGIYVHNTWTTANITTLSHGVIHVDSRGSCPTLVWCISQAVNSWHLNQTLGIEYKNGGWYEAQDP